MSKKIIDKQFTISFSSDTALNAKNKSANGSRFSVYLDEPLKIPQTAVDCTVSVNQALIWNISPNISASQANNTLNIITTLGGGNFSIVIPDGLFSLADLSSYLSREFVALGYPSNIIQLGSLQATSQVVISFPLASVQCDFTQPNSIRTVLGFDSRLAPLVPSLGGESEVGDTQAKFNVINYYKIRGDLISNGIAQNNVANGTIGIVPISVRPGSQIIYSPFNPTKSDASELIGTSKTFINFQLTDENGLEVSTGGENYSFDVIFRWKEIILV